MQVSITNARNKLSGLIKTNENGQPVTLCRRGRPVVDIVPTKASIGKKRIFGTQKGRIEVLDPDWWKPSDSI